jgi:hypothetical protein
MQSIICTYYGPTSTRGSRIVARASGDGNTVSATIGYPHQLSGADVYWAAAEKLAKKLGWSGSMLAGYLKPGQYVFVFRAGQQFNIQGADNGQK